MAAIPVLKRSMNSFQYLSLEPSKEEIRLFQLQASSNPTLPVIGKLLCISLTSKPTYEALSYTWGVPGTAPDIEINGSRFTPQENLHAALLRLRLPKKPRTLWIDAICINQKDDRERSEQVLLMSQIYQQAERVVVWLGEPTPQGILGMKWLQGQLSYMYHEFKAEKNCHGYGKAYWSRFLANDVSMQDDTNLSDERGNGEVRELLDRPWWRRVWIVQEAVLAKTLILMCGPETASWESVKKVTKGTTFRGYTVFGVRSHPFLTEFPDASYEEISRLREERSGRHHRICELLYDYRTFNCTDPRDRIYAFLGLASDAENLKIKPDYTIPLQELYLDFAWRIIQMHKNLSILNFTRAWRVDENSHQTHFAYTLTDQIKYHDTDALIRNEPSGKTRVGWARLPDGWERKEDGNKIKFVNHSSGEVLDSSPLDHKIPIYIPSFDAQKICPVGWTKVWDNLGRAVVQFDESTNSAPPATKSSLDLPSWVPNWALWSSSDSSPLLKWLGTASEFYAFGLKSIVNLTPGSNGRILSVDGIIFDEIESLGPVWHPTVQDPPRSRRKIQELQEWEKIALAKVPSCPYGSIKAREEAFWRAHIADAAPPHATPIRDIAYFYTWLDGDEWDIDSLTWNRGYFKSLSDSWAFQKVSLRMTGYFREVNEEVNGTHLIWSPIVKKNYGRYLRRIHKVCAHRAVFVSKKGYIGLAPWNAERGDKVAIIEGGYTPFLLRERPGQDEYELVGESYVSGLMVGQALALARKDVRTLNLS
jgi:heterokaryon incompatibility protein (HET)